MRKNLLQEETKKELIDRISRLTPQSQRQWGKMNVNQMLRHANDGLKIAYGDIKSEANKATGLKRMIMRFFVLKSDVPTPKAKAVTFPEINMVELGVDPKDFEAERAALIEIISKFPEKPTYHTSNLLGKASTKDWGRLNYTHIHHHLLQFGA